MVSSQFCYQFDNTDGLAIQVVLAVGVGFVRYPGEKHYECGTVQRHKRYEEWVGGCQISRKKCYVTVEWPQMNAPYLAVITSFIKYLCA